MREKEIVYDDLMKQSIVEYMRKSRRKYLIEEFTR